jgi:hypothetical protein
LSPAFHEEFFYRENLVYLFSELFTSRKKSSGSQGQFSNVYAEIGDTLCGASPGTSASHGTRTRHSGHPDWPDAAACPTFVEMTPAESPDAGSDAEWGAPLGVDEGSRLRGRLVRHRTWSMGPLTTFFGGRWPIDNIGISRGWAIDHVGERGTGNGERGTGDGHRSRRGPGGRACEAVRLCGDRDRHRRDNPLRKPAWPDLDRG